MVVCLSPGGPNVHSSDGPPEELAIATTEGVVFLSRSGKGGVWQEGRRALDDKHIHVLWIEPTRGILFAGTHGDGIYASSDGGRTWDQRNEGLRSLDIYCMESLRVNGRLKLYVGTEPAHLFISTDFGESWQELPAVRDVPDTDRWWFPAPPHIAHVKHIAFDPRDSLKVFVSVEQGALLKSDDGGKTFREVTSYIKPDDEIYRDIHRILISPSNPDTLYFTGGMGLYHSQDAGETWEHLIPRSYRIGYPDALLFSPFDEKVMFMAGAKYSPGPPWRQADHTHAAIARSSDGGRTWQILSDGVPEDIHGNIEAMSICSWPTGFGIFAGTTDGEVFASDDQGEHWSSIVQGLAPVSKDGHHKGLSIKPHGRDSLQVAPDR